MPSGCVCTPSSPATLPDRWPVPVCPPPPPIPPHPRSNVAEFNRGDLFVIRYRAVQQLLAEGAVELV